MSGDDSYIFLPYVSVGVVGYGERARHEFVDKLKGGTSYDVSPSFETVLLFCSELKDAQFFALVIGVGVDDLDGVYRVLQVLEVLEAVLCEVGSFSLGFILLILFCMYAYDDSLLIFVDVYVLAVIRTVSLCDFLRHIGGEDIVVSCR